jgi:hypothetical protein
VTHISNSFPPTAKTVGLLRALTLRVRNFRRRYLLFAYVDDQDVYVVDL